MFNKLEHGATEFKLEAEIDNANNHSVNVCRKGETAILHFVTYGYAGKVVVSMPEELKPGNESMQLIYDYDSPVYIKEEHLAFVIPLYCESREYEFIVRAYKDGRELVAKLSLFTIGADTVLNVIGSGNISF